MLVQIATLLKKDPQTKQKFNSRFLRSSFILASDTIVGKFTAIVIETVTFVANLTDVVDLT